MPLAVGITGIGPIAVELGLPQLRITQALILVMPAGLGVTLHKLGKQPILFPVSWIVDM